MRAKRTLLIALIASSAGMAANPGKDAVPLFFIENQGQAPSSIRFMAKGSGVTAYFSAGEAQFRMAGASVRLDFEGANLAARLEGIDRLPSYANFLIGVKENWRLDVPTYRAIRYRELYPGIDMTYGGTGRELKSEFVVAPGADTARIRMRYLGTGDLRIEDSGELVIPLSARKGARQGARELREHAPILYQEFNGRRVPVDGRFVLLDGHGVGFTVGKYDLARPLVIDPVLSYSTLLGGSGFDSATALAVDSAGSAYVAGFTDSFDLPAASPEQNFNAGGNDVFVAKLNPSGNGLVYCTYLGGRGDDRAYGVAVDASGSAYVTGTTTSTNFPVRNALQPGLAGGRNAFAAKLSPAGNVLVFSTYLGGNGSDTGYGIALDGSGNAYIVGDTTSLNFPASGMQRGYHGAQDAFVAKVSTDGSRLVYSTYLGGGNTDHGAAIAVDSGGSAYVTGSTWSTDFPVANAFQSTAAGGQDAFLARLSPDGNTLLFSTYAGGSGGTVAYPEAGQAIALDGQGYAYVTGVTSSSDFPTLHALQPTRAGFTDAFVSKVSASGALTYSTYLGGSGVEVGNTIVVDSGGRAYVAGYTYSTDLPVVNALQPGMAGECDAFLAYLSPAGDALSYLSYLGGNGSDTATALALDQAGAVYVAGWTLSSNFPLMNPFQSTNAGNYGAFVTKMVLGAVAVPPALSVTKTHGSSFTQGQTGAAYSITVSNAAGAGATSGTVTVTESFPNGLMPVSMSGTGWTCPASTCTRNDALAGGASYPAITVTVNVSANAASPQINAVSVSGGGSATANTSDSTTITQVAASAVTADSVSPSSGSTASATLTAVYSNTAGFANLGHEYLLINTAVNGANACYVVYQGSNNTLLLLNDAGNAWLGPIVAGTSATLQNSQCVLNGIGSSGLGSGNRVTLTVSLSFKAAFVGSRTVFLNADGGGLSSGWQSRGTWTVPNSATAAVTADSVSPSSGNTANATLTAVYSHTAGFANLAHEYMLINTALDGSHACYVVYQGSNNTLMLLDDAGTAWLGPVVAGTGATLQNSQCILNGIGSSGVGSGNSLTLTVSLSFKAAFAGNRTVFLNADGGGLGAGWQSRGTWTVPSGAVVTADSVSPSSGNTANATLTAVYGDTAGFANLAHEYLLINTAVNGSNACYMVYQGSNNTLMLLNDAGTAWLGPIVAGTGATLQNSQCILNGIGSSGVGSGNSLALTVSLSFKAAFAGSRMVFLNADAGALSSGWQSRGTWTVPSGAAAVTADSVSPTSGNTANATLTAVYNDTAGFANLGHEYLLINTAVNGSNACYVVYQGANNTLMLANDAGTVWLGPIVAGTGATLQNSQCILNGTGSSGVGSGNSLALTVSLSFKAAFTGSKTVFLTADGGGLTSGWQNRGTWTAP